MEKSDKIILLSNIVLVGFFVAIIFHYFCANVLGLGDPLNTFLLYREWIFSDFVWVSDATRNLAPLSKPNIWIIYFPFAYVFLFPFTLIKNILLSYFLFVSVFISFFTYLNFKFLKCKKFNKLQNFQNIFILTFMTYPFLYLLERGNFDMYLILFMTVFVFAFIKKKYIISAVALALINAIKPFSCIFLVLFLFEKKWKELFLSLFITFLLITGSFFILKGDILSQINILKTNFDILSERFLYHPLHGTTNSTSVFFALKLFIFSMKSSVSTYLLVKVYGFISFVLTALTVFFTWKEKVFWKKITLLTLYTLTVPYVVFDYKIIFLFIPIWLFINQEEKTEFDLIYTILFGLLLIPKKFFWFFGFHILSVYLNPVIILSFMGLIIFEQFKLKKIAK